MHDEGVTWTYENLSAFIENPRSFMPAREWSSPVFQMKPTVLPDRLREERSSALGCRWGRGCNRGSCARADEVEGSAENLRKLRQRRAKHPLKLRREPPMRVKRQPQPMVIANFSQPSPKLIQRMEKHCPAAARPVIPSMKGVRIGLVQTFGTWWAVPWRTWTFNYSDAAQSMHDGHLDAREGVPSSKTVASCRVREWSSGLARCG